MSLELLHATSTVLVLWTCLSFSVGLPISNNTTVVAAVPTKFLKSSVVTSLTGVTRSKDRKNEIVRATVENRSPALIGSNFYRLPPSPANLLKPDGFQFYTYNERGDMITRQMTMQEIQSLIAGGGPDHSNVEIQEPQKAEDILTGGKKVMDVVEKVQNVLKSAMGKPLTTLTGSLPTIPEKANVEWSNILPAILAGDKYGNKIEETEYVEEATSKPIISMPVTVSNDSSNKSDTIDLVQLEHVDRNREQTITAVPYTEKLMIPVPVITTERNTEEFAQHAAIHNPIFHETTQPQSAPLHGYYAHQYHNHHKEKVPLPSTNTNTNLSTTTAAPSSSPLQFTENNNDQTEELVLADVTKNQFFATTKQQSASHHHYDVVVDSPTTPTIPIKGTTVGDGSGIATTMNSEDQILTTNNEPFTALPLQSSVSFTITNTDKFVTASRTESSTIAHDATMPVTKQSEFLESATPSSPTPQPLKPLPMELVNSLSSVISQVSENVHSLLPAVSELGSVTNGNGNHDERNNGSEITTVSTTSIHAAVMAAAATVAIPPVTHEEKPFEQSTQESSSAETTIKFEEEVSNISPASFDATTDLNKTTSYSDIFTTKSDAIYSVPNVSLASNVTETTTSSKGTTLLEVVTSTTSSFIDLSKNNLLTVVNFTSSKPVATINDILRTASTEANTIVTEPLTLPNNLPGNFSSNTLASALIAGFQLSKLNKTEDVSYNATMSPPTEKLYSNNENTSTHANSKVSISLTTLDNTSTQRTSTTAENLSQLSSSHKETPAATVSPLETSDPIELSQQENGLSTISIEKIYGVSLSASTTSPPPPIPDNVVKNSIANESDASTTNSVAFFRHTSSPIYETWSTSSTSLSVTEFPTGNPFNLDLQKLGGGNESRIESTAQSVTSEIASAVLEAIPQDVVEEKDNRIIVGTYSDDTTEYVSSTEHINRETITPSHITTPYDHSTTNKKTESTMFHSIGNSSNGEDRPAANSTDSGVQQGSPPIEKETAVAQEEKYQTVYTSNDAIDASLLATTTNLPKISSKGEIMHSSNKTTATKSSPAKESSGDKGGIANAIDPLDLDRSENKSKESNESHEGNNETTKNSIGMGLLGTSEKSQINEKSNDSENSTLESELKNSTNQTNLPQHVWQRISLHSTTQVPSVTDPSTNSTAFTTTRTATATSRTPEITTAGESEMMETTHFHSNSTIETVSLDASKSIGGLDTSTRNASIDIVNFSRLCNQLAMKFWIAANKGLSTGRSVALSPFGMISLLAMIFLGARGSTSDQMNEVLGLDNVATFNPHLVFQNVTDAVSLARHQGIANAAFVRELFADKAKVRKLLPFYKEQVQQFYEGLVAEVNFATISDLVRRRTNLLIRKQTGGRIKDFVKSNAVPLRSPLAAISANVFQTDCNTSSASATGRDGELYFAVSSAHRLRKLIPVPATVWRSNVLAGYEPSLDATAVALGGTDKLVSTIFLLPGQQGHAAPGDTLDRLEQRLVKGAFRDGSWNKLLKVLIPRTALQLQIPKFSHRSVVNATAALKRMGLDQLFSSHADFKGINGIGNRLFLSDVLQMNLFSTCGDENIANGRHHVEIYPASPSLRNSRRGEFSNVDVSSTFDRRTRTVHFPSGSYYSTVPIKMATRRRRSVERSEDQKPRLKLDQPFLYLVRHNPTGLILHMGRFNPRLL